LPWIACGASRIRIGLSWPFRGGGNCFVFTDGDIVSPSRGVDDFPRFGRAPYHNLVTDGNLAVLLEIPTDLQPKARAIFEAHHSHHIGEPEWISL
jgi:hypothetical protein